MNFAQETDFTTLGWVKSELDSTLADARHALERFATNSADSQALRSSAEGLHITHGTLKMVEMYGAALVVEEMERVARGMLDGSIAPREDVYAVLMRGFLQLPDYLERVQSGHKDIPIVLLPLLNDLRAARGEKLLSEAVLFSPSIDDAPPEPTGQPLHPDVLQKTAVAWRNDYQVALLNWIRGANPGGALTRMEQIFDQLYVACAEVVTRRLWWIAAAVADDVRFGGIESSVAVRLLFGRLDREIKRLIDEGETAFVAAPPKDLVKNLLYYLAHAETHSQRAAKVAEFFRLERLMPSQDELAHAHGSVSGHNRALLDTVAGGIREDLLRVKDTLNIYLHSPRRNVADLAAQGETLAGIADTFGMLGLGKPREIVQEQRAALSNMVSGDSPADENSLLDIAGALLVVEASLEDHIARLGAKPAAEPAQEHSVVPRVEVVRLLYVLMQEALVNVGKIKQCVLAYIESAFDRVPLEPVPDLLTEVAGALDMLALRDVAKPVNMLVNFVREELLGLHRIPDERQTRALADAIAALEYYIEAVRDQRGDRDRSLILLQQSMTALHAGAGAAPFPSSADSLGVATPAPTVAAFDAAPARAPAAPSPSAVPVIDDELRQVFLDEMDDEIASLRKHFPAWRADPDEQVEHLRTVRRSFHTLKGSGRLVGAAALGDFAWTVENMLNRVLDHSVTVSEPLLQVVGEAIEVLPRFREELRKGEPSSFAQAPFAAKVAAILAGDSEPMYVAPSSHDAAPSDGADSTPSTHSVDTSTHEVEAHASDVTASGAGSTSETPSESSAADHAERAQPHGDAPAETPHEVVASHDASPSAAQAPHEPASDAPALTTPDPFAHAGTDAPAPSAVEPNVAAFEANDASTQPATETSFDGGDHAVTDSEAGAPDAAHPGEVIPATHELHRDPLLLDVLRSEAHTHLAVIDAAVRRGHEPAQQVSEELLRSSHTLNGAFAMADVGSIAQVLMPLEAWLARLRNAGRPFDADSIDVLAQVSTATRETLAAFTTPGTPLGDYSALAARVVALRHGIFASEAIVDPASEPTPPEASAPTASSAPAHSAAPSASTEALASEPAAVPTSEQSAASAYAALLDQVEHGATVTPAQEPAAAPSEHASHSEAETPSQPPALVDATPDAPAETAAEPPAASETAPASPASGTDVDEDLLDVFVLEAQEILDRCDASLLSLRGAPGDTKLLDELRRDLHTVKGGANMSGLAPIGELGHTMESLLEGAVEHGHTLDGAALHAIEQGFDTLHTLVQAAASRKPMSMPQALIARIDQLSRADLDTPAAANDTDASQLSDNVVSSAPDAATAAPVGEPFPAIGDTPADEPLPAAESEPVFAGSEYIRVRANQLDAMVNGASEVAIYRSRLEQQMSSYRGNAVEMEATVTRLREQLRRLELEAEAQIASRFQREGDASKFDPLELDRFSQLQQLSRSLAESMSDLVAIQVGFDQLTRQSESLLTQQSRVSADLQESLMRSRMVQFDSLVPALRRTLRQTATALGKEAQLRVEGAQGEMDRTLLERMKAPLEHMLRNALAHGIESVPERLAAGKPIEGNVRIVLAREATETVLRISDDGRGLDRAAIRRRAIERGLLAADAKVSDRELDAFILTSGFSTAENLSQIAGRGVGMDVVANQIKQLGGSLAMESNTGRGAAFTVRLPFTLGVTQAIIVRLGDTNYAIPMNAVQGAVHVGRADLEARLSAEEPEYIYSGDAYPILDLAPMLGEATKGVADGVQVPLLMIRSGDERAALRVDAVLGSREIVVKSVGSQITSVPGILGATIMGDGSVIMILDLAPLLRRVSTFRAQGVAPPLASVQYARSRHLVMVVDDSITMRKATSRVLEREDMDVITAKDGIDAIEKLAERIPDLILLDIEMPRMDGYQFAEHVKGDPRTKHVPIIMITSRTGEKHRDRAREIGVEGYLGKPYQEAELINNVREKLNAAQSNHETP